MPRGRSRGSVILRGKIYYVKYSVAGQQRMERVGPSATDAKRFLSRRLSDIDQGLLATERPVTFRQFVERWTVDYLTAAQLKPSTLAGYRSALERHLLPYFGDQRIDRINTASVQRFVSGKVAEASKRGRVLHPKTIRNCVGLLKKIFNTAVDWQMLTRTPVTRITLPKHRSREMDFLRPHEVRLLLENASCDEMRCLFSVAVFTGMRQGELLALQWGDIDWNRKIIRVRRALSAGTLQTPKTAKSIRDIQVGKQLLLALREHQLRTGGRSEFVFSTRTGGRIDPGNLLKRELHPALRRAGLRQIRFHDLRHTYASILINEGVNLKFVSNQLGHASIQITLDRYSHLIPERHEASVNLLENLVLSTAAPKAAEAST